MSSPAASASPALTPGTLISDDVEVLSRVSLNGPVARYMARQLGRRGHVLVHVLTVPPPVDGPDMALRELEHAGTLSHLNLAQRQGCGRATQETLYVVEGYPPGELLDEALDPEGACIPVVEAARRALCLLRALTTAHEAGSYHGMLSPTDVLVERTEMSDARVRLIGLGIVQALRSAGIQAAAADSAYVPAEARATDAQADLYAVAAMTLASIAGTAAVRALHADDGDASLPPSVFKTPLGPVLRRALHTDPEARFPSAAAFAEAVSEVLDALAPAAGTDARPDDQAQDIVGFDASLSSIVGSSGPGMMPDGPGDVAVASGDWRDLLPSTSRSGRHSALAALQAELAFSGGGDDDALASALHDDERDSTRVSGPPVPEDSVVTRPAADAAAADEVVAETSEPAEAPAVEVPPSLPPELIDELATASSADRLDSDVTRLSPPPVGPAPREESTQVGRPLEPSISVIAAGLVEQRATDNAGGLRTETTNVASRPIVSDGTLPPPPPVRTAPVDAPPPGSAFELMVELEDEVDDAAADPLGSGVTVLRSPEPVEAVLVVVHEALLPSTIPVERLLARELEPFEDDDDDADEPGEVTSPGRPRHLALAGRIVDPAETPLAAQAAAAVDEPPRRSSAMLVGLLVAAAVIGFVLLGKFVLFADDDPQTVEPASATPAESEPVEGTPSEQGETTSPDDTAQSAGTTPPPEPEPDDATVVDEGPDEAEPTDRVDSTEETDDQAVAQPADEVAEEDPEEAARRKERREKRRREREARKNGGSPSNDGGGSILDLKVD